MILQRSVGWKGVEMRVQTDTQGIEGRFMVAVAGNIRRYAGGLARLSPVAKWDDGLRELWLFGSGKKGGAGMAVRHLWNLGWGRHVQDSEMICLPFRQATIKFETEEWMQMDGEPMGMVKAAALSVQEQVLKVIVPNDVE
jgi:diacylglycerol kinase family enzyme